jgi:hypothetical protein
MSLPIVLEIALGLTFTYLTLSLVASEIQEILSVLFQWRAEHLKRSIEQLLAGDAPRSRTDTQASAQAGTQTSIQTSTQTKEQGRQNWQAAKTLADRLYESPLIENLNYQAQGRLTGLLRSLLHAIGAIYRTLTFSRNVFGHNTSGPSYIPAETFATSLIERLRLEDFQRIMGRSRFEQFIDNDVRLPLHNMVSELRAQLQDETLLTAEMTYFDQALNQIVADLAARRLTLEAALDQVLAQLESFAAMAADMPLGAQPGNAALAQSFLNRVRYLRAALFGQTQQAGQTQAGSAQTNNALIARLRPTLADITALLDPDSVAYAELVAIAQQEGGALLAAVEKLRQETVPPRLRESLATLANQASKRTASSDMQQFQAELESWFNHGMERASGVYRRNVKGVGLLVGLAIAFAINADTLYMFQRLSSDQAIRGSIVQAANQLEVRGIDSADDLANDIGSDQLSARMLGVLRALGSAVEETLAEYPLPIGRTEAVMAAQQAAEANWPIPLIPQRLVGWSITALALSMGARFWFDLLRKVMSVRAAGDRPKT